jgi:hypothetical protein
MFCFESLIDLASSHMTTRLSAQRFIIILWLSAGVAKTHPIISKSASFDLENTPGSNHDNQRSVRSSDAGNDRLPGRTFEFKTDGNSNNNNNNDIFEFQIEPARVESRPVIRPRRSVAELTATSIVQQGQPQSSTPSSMSLPSKVISSPTMANVMTGNHSQESSSTEYSTVNYDGLVGINATDPYAIVTESRMFALPTEIQVSHILS